MQKVKEKVFKFVRLTEKRAIEGKSNYLITETYTGGISKSYDLSYLEVICDSDCVICLNEGEFLQDECLLKVVTIQYIQDVQLNNKDVIICLKDGQTIKIEWN